MKKILAAILFMLASSANAGVTYQWHATSVHPGHNMEMRIVFSEAAIQSGSVNHWNFACEESSSSAQCNDDVQSFYFSGGTQHPIQYVFGNPSYTSEDFLGLEIIGEFKNGYFNGNIWARTEQTEIVVYDGRVWHLESTIPGDICNLGDTCEGDVGVIRAVPEPSTIALFGLSLGGLWFARRRSKRTTR